MALNMRIEVTSGVAATEVPEDIAADLAEAYATLSKLPVNRMVTVDFDSKAEALEFARQGKAWAAVQTPPLTFVRKGDIKALPSRVSFRIYLPKPKTD